MIMASDLWPGLDLRHLSAFEAVHKTGSFARAAEILGYTQPAVSQQISSLERIVGQRLFDRSSGRADVRLTEAGRILLHHVEAVGARLATARTELTQLDRGEAGSLAVGAFQSAAAQILPAILKRLRDDRSGLRVDLTERMLDSDLLAELHRGNLDLVFAMLPLDEEEFDYVELVRDRFYLVSPANGSFPTQIESLAELKDVPMLTYRTCRSVAILTSHLRAAGVEPNYVFRSDDNSALKALVRSGLGVALMPSLWIEMGGNEGLEICKNESLLPSRTITLAWNKNRLLTPAQHCFIEAARRVYASSRRERRPALSSL
jgi:DNA-binding transcriptional LysR family regulator